MIFNSPDWWQQKLYSYSAWLWAVPIVTQIQSSHFERHQLFFVTLCCSYESSHSLLFKAVNCLWLHLLTSAVFNLFSVSHFQMYRGSFPGGFPPNFQGPLHGPPRPRFPYPPENRWAVFSVQWYSFIQDFFHEMDIKISKQWNQWNSEKLCVVFYCLLVGMYCPWNLVGSWSPCRAVECSFSLGCSVCCCCFLSHTGLSWTDGAFFVPIAFSVLSFYTGSCLRLVPLLLQWMRR